MKKASAKVKPLISYYGGKQRMASKIVPLLPEHTVYVEPFAGGAAVLFAKPWPKIKNRGHYREVLNDSSKKLTDMYEYALDNPDAFVEMLANTPYSAAMYAKAQRISSDDNACKKWSAWATCVLLQQSFGNRHGEGWGTSCASQNHAVTWHCRARQEAVSRLEGVYIENTDAIKCIKKWDSPQTLFYCDPPYVGSDCRSYLPYSIEDFQLLINTLDRCDASFVLSCYANDNVFVPAAWEKFSFETSCSVSGEGRTGRSFGRRHKACDPLSVKSRKRMELIFRRFNTVPWRPDLEKIRQAGKYSCFARNPNELPRQREMRL